MTQTITVSDCPDITHKDSSFLQVQSSLSMIFTLPFLPFPELSTAIPGPLSSPYNFSPTVDGESLFPLLHCLCHNSISLTHQQTDQIAVSTKRTWNTPATEIASGETKLFWLDRNQKLCH